MTFLSVKKQITLSIAKVFQTPSWLRLVTSQINNNLLISQQNNNSFTKRVRVSLLHFRKYDSLYNKGFSKHPFLTTCSLFLTVMRCVAFQINTDFLLNLLKNIFHSENLTPLLHVTKTALSIADVSFATFLYQFCATFLLVFTSFYLIFTSFYSGSVIFRMNIEFVMNQESFNETCLSIKYRWRYISALIK